MRVSEWHGQSAFMRPSVPTVNDREYPVAEHLHFGDGRSTLKMLQEKLVNVTPQLFVLVFVPDRGSLRLNLFHSSPFNRIVRAGTPSGAPIPW